MAVNPTPATVPIEFAEDELFRPRLWWIKKMGTGADSHYPSTSFAHPGKLLSMMGAYPMIDEADVGAYPCLFTAREIFERAIRRVLATLLMRSPHGATPVA
jgi:hypothetical protein